MFFYFFPELAKLINDFNRLSPVHISERFKIVYFLFLLSNLSTAFVISNESNSVSLYYKVNHKINIVSNFTSFDIYNKQIKVYKDVEFNLNFDVVNIPAYYDYYRGNIITYKYLTYSYFINKKPLNLTAQLFYLNIKHTKKYYYIFKNFIVVYETIIDKEKANLIIDFEPLYFSISFKNKENNKICKSIQDLWSLVTLKFVNDKIKDELHEINILNFSFCFYRNDYEILDYDNFNDETITDDIFIDAFYDLEDLIYIEEKESEYYENQNIGVTVNLKTVVLYFFNLIV